ncbi:MAG: hypothetical protein L6R40_000316 [Gallowayella cf. fulva]|nr:MAG: hypothetical protein L6R40_000316 [Xanthomendoza cf. fulva]
MEVSTKPSALSRAGAAAAAVKTTTNGTQTDTETSMWTPSSWTTKPIKQDVVYDDRAAVSKALAKLERCPPIVTPTEICRLKRHLRDVALGKSFLLQGGDCAELFDYCESGMIESKIKLLLQMSLVLIYGAGKPVVRIARMAGQFAKPRSSPTEQHNGKIITAFRGDNVNGYDPGERTPDPSRLVSAYFHSAATSNYIRASLASGIADLHSPLDWELGHVKEEDIKAKYETIVNSITESLRFMKTVGADSAASSLETVELFTSHEGLLLEYEQSLTRLLKTPAFHQPSYPASAPSHPNSNNSPDHINDNKQYYNTSAHFLWIGDRTRQLHGAHIEYFRGIANPIGLKIGPSMPASEIVPLLDLLNPTLEIGKITLITRYGAAHISSLLPSHIRAVQASRHNGTVIWQCDPMHGNTRSTPSGVKTRRFSDILSEVGSAMQIHTAMGTHLGGVHLELTGEAVTECVGGSEGLGEGDLEGGGYKSFCDPRLNEKQALELAFLVAGGFRGEG